MRALGGYEAGTVVVVAAAGVVVVAAAEIGAAVVAVVGGEDVDDAGVLPEKRGGAYVELVMEAALVVAVAALKK